MSKSLKAHLEANPHLQTVYLNDKNEWQFHKRKGYEKEVSAQDVIENGLPDAEDDEDQKLDSADIEAILKLAKNKVDDAETEAELAKEEAENAKSLSDSFKSELEKVKIELAKLKAEKSKKAKSADELGGQSSGDESGSSEESDNKNINA